MNSNFIVSFIDLLKKAYWKVDRTFFFYLYYLVARYLPVEIAPLGSVSNRVRSTCCRHLFDSFGENAKVERGVWFRHGGGVSLGNNSVIGINANINGYAIIGNDVLMGPDVIIMSRNHIFKDRYRPIRLQGYTEHRRVIIEDDVWIGARVIILPGVTIGKGSIIAAGAVVSRDVPPHSVAAGVPARIIKKR